MAALKKKGYIVQPFKVGPDFLDPLHHTWITGRASRNLDGWMLSQENVLKTFQYGCRGADIAIIEGMMGLFDGKDITSDSASTAEIAKWLGAPVLLVVDGSGLARSLKALLQGFKNFDRSLSLSGVIFNRATNKSHLDWLKDIAVDDLPSFGGLLNDLRIQIPERHLGLIGPESKGIEGFNINVLIQMADSFINLKEIVNVAQSVLPLKSMMENQYIYQPRCRIAVARDAAFHFYYQDNLDLLQKEGAELVEFSPVHDEDLPRNIHGIYIGGGYPELFLKELSGNQAMKTAVRDFVEAGGPVYAECGGMMYVTDEIRTVSNERFEMVSVIPGCVQMEHKLSALGYIEVEATDENPFMKKGERARGHEFHFSTWEKSPLKKRRIKAGYLVQGNGNPRKEGYIYKNLLGSYIHLHFGSNPGIAKSFVEQCEKREKKF
jgi:cobyrinic acid a,c-diamide synthase